MSSEDLRSIWYLNVNSISGTAIGKCGSRGSNLTDLDITGGNSGSATLNSKGEFSGIAFDGNIEGVASDLVFLPEVTRAIHVDVRYILWILDEVENADHLLYEMGIEAKHLTHNVRSSSPASIH